jgi:hypothetical protein
MRRLACTAVVIALASAGCIGSSSSSSPAPSTGHIGVAPAHTELTITYMVSTCPPGEMCTVMQSYSIVSRHLTCSPNAGGDYPDPAAVCRALNDVVAKLDARPATACLCPSLERPPKAVGYYNGEPRTIPLDWCSLCNIPGLVADIHLLLPGAP